MIPEQEWLFGTLLRIPHPPICFGKEEKDKYYIQFADPRYIPDWNMPYKMVHGEVEPKTIGQYTGLKDKNGKEIYEGDIVAIEFQRATKRGRAVVVYDNKYASFVIKETGEIAHENENIGDYQMENFEVIGNIYDNPELVKE